MRTSHVVVVIAFVLVEGAAIGCAPPSDELSSSAMLIGIDDLDAVDNAGALRTGSFGVGRSSEVCTHNEAHATFDGAPAPLTSGLPDTRLYPIGGCDGIEGSVTVTTPETAHDGTLVVEVDGITARYTGKNLVAHHVLVADGPVVDTGASWQLTLHVEPTTDTLTLAGPSIEPPAGVSVKRVDGGHVVVEVPAGTAQSVAVDFSFDVDTLACDFVHCHLDSHRRQSIAIDAP